VDPFALLRLPLLALKFWVGKVGLKAVLIGMGASTIAVVMYGCVEGGNW
jgi:hypothetical protein